MTLPPIAFSVRPGSSAAIPFMSKSLDPHTRISGEFRVETRVVVTKRGDDISALAARVIPQRVAVILIPSEEAC